MNDLGPFPLIAQKVAWSQIARFCHEIDYTYDALLCQAMTLLSGLNHHDHQNPVIRQKSEKCQLVITIDWKSNFYLFCAVFFWNQNTLWQHVNLFLLRAWYPQHTVHCTCSTSNCVPVVIQQQSPWLPGSSAWDFNHANSSSTPFIAFQHRPVIW